MNGVAMSNFNPIQAVRTLLARRRNRWVDEARFCDSCSRVDDVAGSAIEHRQLSFNAYVGHAPRSFG